MPLKVRIANLNKKFNLNMAFLERAARNIIRFLNVKRGLLEIVFVDNTRIRTLNRKFRNENRATDVLSFDLTGTLSKKNAFLWCIFISSEMARTNASRYQTLFEKELLLYVVHGILHLFGYDDLKTRDRKKMRNKETEIMEILCRRNTLSRLVTYAKN